MRELAVGVFVILFRIWGRKRDMHIHGTIEGQMKKLREEIQELQDAIDLGDRKAGMDAVGDTIAVLCQMCLIYGWSVAGCCWLALKDIWPRTGRMFNGVFIKDE